MHSRNFFFSFFLCRGGAQQLFQGLIRKSDGLELALKRNYTLEKNLPSRIKLKVQVTNYYLSYDTVFLDIKMLIIEHKLSSKNSLVGQVERL